MSLLGEVWQKHTTWVSENPNERLFQPAKCCDKLQSGLEFYYLVENSLLRHWWFSFSFLLFIYFFAGYCLCCLKRVGSMLKLWLNSAKESLALTV